MTIETKKDSSFSLKRLINLLPFFMPLPPNLIEFLTYATSACLAANEIEKHLLNHGLSRLSENAEWKLKPGHAYFVRRRGTIAAFVLPSSLPLQSITLLSHTDSPGFRLKPFPEIRKQGMLLFGLEVYGSPILSSWLNRDLGLSGQVLIRQKGQVKTVDIRIDDPALIIPQLALHLDREINEKGVVLNKQDHLLALVGLDKGDLKAGTLLEHILSPYVSFDTLLSHELYLYTIESPRILGKDQELLASGRIDGLANAHAVLTAFCSALKPAEDILKMFALYDHEEIGSHSASGAASPFLSALLERIFACYNASREDYWRCLASSTAFSVDLAHAVHPTHVERHDPQHAPILGKGVVIKYHAQQRYATHAVLLQSVLEQADQLKIPLQHFVMRGDLPSGSTIGPIHAADTGMNTIDLGIPQLSMHSAREVISLSDHQALIAFLSSMLSNSVLK